MGEEDKNPNPIHIVPELLEEIFLGLPLKSVLNFKTVSKQWRSILESNMFVERRMSLQKSHRKILAAYNCDCGDRPRLLPESRFEGDEEIVFLHCNASRPMLTCDGLVCFPDEDCIIVLNPSTGKLLRFPCAPGQLSSRGGTRLDIFIETWVMGFGRDKVTGSYKVVKMCVAPMNGECDLLDVENGEWKKKLKLPPYVVSALFHSVCVNGSIYWLVLRLLNAIPDFRILALDLHKEEFHDVSVPPTLVTRETQIANLEGRLAIANRSQVGPECILVIHSMNAQEETWSTTYAIDLASLPESKWGMWFTPVAVTEQGDLVFSSNHPSLYKYYPETNELRCLSSSSASSSFNVISPYLENSVPLRSESGLHDPDSKIRKPCRLLSKPPSSKIFKEFKLLLLEIVFTTLIIVILGYFFLSVHRVFFFFFLEKVHRVLRWWEKGKSA